MKILMLSRDMDLGGVPTCIVDFSECLIRKGHQVALMAWAGPEVQKRTAHAYQTLISKWTLDQVMDRYLEVYRQET